MSHTHTYAVLQVSPATYREIRDLLEAAGYADQFHTKATSGIVGEIIDMHGLALIEHPGRCEVCNVSLVRCEYCDCRWCLDHQPNPLVCPKCGRRP